MLRIYLDQNKWIDLARAATGHPDGTQFHDALAMSRTAVQAGDVSFPLDIYRYWETSKRGNADSRLRVVEVMRELSRGHTLAPPFGLLDQELDTALSRLFEVATEPRKQQVFGLGVRHISGDRVQWPTVDSMVNPVLSRALPSGTMPLLQDEVNDLLEAELLGAGPEMHRRAGRPLSEYDQAQRFVEFENEVAAAIKHHNLKGDHVDLAIRASDLGDIRPPLDAALQRIGMTFEQLHKELGASGLLGFIDQLPTRHVTSVLRSARHRQTHHEWEANDFVDIVALPVAATYCDLVVTEKQWAHHLRQGKIPEKYNTIVLSTLKDLTQVIVNASLR